MSETDAKTSAAHNIVVLFLNDEPKKQKNNQILARVEKQYLTAKNCVQVPKCWDFSHLVQSNSYYTLKMAFLLVPILPYLSKKYGVVRKRHSEAKTAHKLSPN